LARALPARAGFGEPISFEEKSFARIFSDPPSGPRSIYQVEEWLDGLKLSNGSRSKIRNVMSALFTHGMRHEWVDRNPITLVRQSAKRERVPDVLDAAEIQLRGS
jgi:hypothetical protein